jgi:hypothetical protein
VEYFRCRSRFLGMNEFGFCKDFQFFRNHSSFDVVDYFVMCFFVEI